MGQLVILFSSRKSWSKNLCSNQTSGLEETVLPSGMYHPQILVTGRSSGVLHKHTDLWGPLLESDSIKAFIQSSSPIWQSVTWRPWTISGVGELIRIVCSAPWFRVFVEVSTISSPPRGSWLQPQASLMGLKLVAKYPLPTSPSAWLGKQ